MRQWEDTLLKKSNKTQPISRLSQLQTNTNTITTTNASNTSLTTSSILTSRVFSSRQRNYPTMVFSIIKYDAGKRSYCNDNTVIH